MQLLAQQLKKYDRYLKVKKNLDGSIVITRKSPFNNGEFVVLTVHNMRVGKWLLKKLYLMDTQRKNIVREVANKNRNIREYRNNDLSFEVADFMTTERIII